MEPTLTQWNNSARNSAINTVLKTKSKEIGDQISASTAVLANTVNNLLRSSQGAQAPADQSAPSPSTTAVIDGAASSSSSAPSDATPAAPVLETPTPTKRVESFVEINLDGDSPLKAPNPLMGALDSDEEVIM